MTDEQLVRIVQTLIWAGAAVVCILMFLPIVRFAIRKEIEFRERDRRPGDPEVREGHRSPGAVNGLRHHRPRV